MRTILKRAILRTLEQRGYVLLKKAAYDHMLAAAAPVASHLAPAVAQAAATPTATLAATAAPTTTQAVPAASTATDAATMAATAPAAPALAPAPPLSTSAIKEFAAAADLRSEFERACERLQGRLTLPVNQALAVYCAVRHLTTARIPGDMIDCGDGRPEVLAVIGCSLIALGETSRRLVLFDITSDHRHRPETNVPLWGTDYDRMAGRRPRPQPKERILPDALAASGYPAERIFVVRYPVDRIELSRPIAFLGLTAETYEANRAAVRTLAPRVSIGGVIAVEGNEHTPRAALPGCVQHHLDAVAEFLKAHRADVPFWQAAPEYRLGVKARPFGEQG
jgi:hypothetical protein